jgi:signal transduction histidine kinase
MQKEALASDMQLLRVYNKLETFYKQHGRRYISMNQYRYVSYRRMLSYDRVLSGVQLDSTLAIIERLAATDSDIHNDLYSKSSSAFARYYFSKKEYKKAITYLDAALESNADSVQWRIPETLKMRVKAGQAIHDTSMHKYLLWYKDYLEKTKNDGVEEKDKELDVIYNLSEVKQKSSEILSAIIFISGLFVLFAIIVIGRLLLRSKTAEESLTKTQKQLLAEKEIISGTMADLKRAEMQANNANKMKTMFLQNMSHEIRTPLNSIIGFSQLIAESGKEMSQKDAATYVDMVSKNSVLLQTLISDVLDIARMEAGELKFNYTDFSANDVCEDSIQIVIRNVLPGVKLVFNRHENEVNVHSDLQRVQQVILNYLTNACKFTKSGSIVLDYKEDIAAGRIKFSVTDTGIGIPADKMDDVFNRFEKLNKFSQGTGLGLHICNLIAKGLHGTAAIDKSYKGGSRFIFDIPMV